MASASPACDVEGHNVWLEKSQDNTPGIRELAKRGFIKKCLFRGILPNKNSGEIRESLNYTEKKVSRKYGTRGHGLMMYSSDNKVVNSESITEKYIIIFWKLTL